MSEIKISYSEFFRETIAYAILEQVILPQIVKKKRVEREIRIWSAGCANGQEAYSMAILLSDLIESSGRNIRFRIFATDISEEALINGRAGVFSENAVQNVKVKHLNKYFIKEGKSYTVIPKLKQYIHFANYDLLDRSTINLPESIYGDFDIVICGNVLIYYKEDAQKAIINKLLLAMAEDGYLVVGETEKFLVENATKLQVVNPNTSVFKMG